jgi:hypothetical protein
MATNYTINWSDDTLKAPFTVVGATFNTATSLILPGRDAVSWGETHNENFVRLLENFASLGTAPANPTIGQLWFNASTNQLQVYHTGAWHPLTYRRIDSASAPTGTHFPGDMWYDTTANLLKVYTNGSTWVSVCSQCGGSPSPSPTPGSPTPSPTPGSPTPSPTPTPTPGGSYFTITPNPGTASRVRNVALSAAVGTYANGTPTGTIIANGGSMPPGLTLSLAGGNVILSGTPTTAGTYSASFWIQASNTNPIVFGGQPANTTGYTINVTVTNVAPTPTPTPSPTPSPAPTPVGSPVG